MAVVKLNTVCPFTNRRSFSTGNGDCVSLNSCGWVSVFTKDGQKLIFPPSSVLALSHSGQEDATEKVTDEKPPTKKAPGRK